MTTNKNTIKGYPRRIESRISETKFQELLTLLSKSQNQTMSSLIRDILSKRKVTITTYDRSLDFVLEELSQIHQQINAIGVNVNAYSDQIDPLSALQIDPPELSSFLVRNSRLTSR
ncbi:plasmid mobilization protein [Belliella pelovolcani]|uniref:Uncharacterized protein n=1 Tax=Belliella pelovolcani TaxID=529505 RepID=A0A1N7PJ70_9BACT|nr:hypothetical protein [Belliella pelovolcani]SIT10429.1 hypothetical protein SAMN05421761_11692 [Belliella pelovolcani]